jgi:hypothetical protein
VRTKVVDHVYLEGFGTSKSSGKTRVLGFVSSNWHRAISNI